MLLRKTSFWVILFSLFFIAAIFLWRMGQMGQHVLPPQSEIAILSGHQTSIGWLHLPQWVIAYAILQLLFCTALYFFNRYYWQESE